MRKSAMPIERARPFRRIACRFGAAALVICLLTGCVPRFLIPRSAPTPAETGSIFTHRYSQNEVEALAESVTGQDGVPSVLLSDLEFWDEIMSVHYGVLEGEVSPEACFDYLGWATLMGDRMPAAGSLTGTWDHPVFVAVTGDRDDQLALAFSAITHLSECSPARVTVDGKTTTVSFRPASAFSEAGLTYSTIASTYPPGMAPRHVLRVAGKIGTLFVQASANIDNPEDYRADADRLSVYINQVVAASRSLAEDGVMPAPGAPSAQKV